MSQEKREKLSSVERDQYVKVAVYICIVYLYTMDDINECTVHENVYNIK